MKKNNVARPEIIWIVFLCGYLGCNTSVQPPEVIENQLNLWGKERTKYDRLIDKFSTEGDTLKLQALYFLIENMQGARSVHFDTTNQNWEITEDFSTLSEDYLSDQINEAVATCRPQLANKSLSFHDFCNYILPYRLDAELPDNWRKEIRMQYSSVSDSIKQLYPLASDSTLIEWFNRKLGNGFEYKPAGNEASLKGWSQLVSEHNGNCMEMTKVIQYPLRALGIPVTSDFTPCWANINGGGHRWNILLRTGAVNMPFMGLEAGTGPYKPFILISNPDSSKSTYRLCGKVYRQSFAINKESIEFINGKREVIAAVFRNARMTDVTDEYFPTVEAKIKCNLSAETRLKNYAYLANFSDGHWVPVAWGKIRNDNTALFEKVVKNVLYLPVILQNDSLVPVNAPFFITTDGTPSFMSKEGKSKFLITYTQSVEQEQLKAISRNPDWGSKSFSDVLQQISDNKLRSTPKKGNVYELSYWNNEWKVFGNIKAHDHQILVENIPAGCVYRLVDTKGKRKERIFTIQNGVQRWW